MDTLGGGHAQTEAVVIVVAQQDLSGGGGSSRSGVDWVGGAVVVTGGGGAGSRGAGVEQGRSGRGGGWGRGSGGGGRCAREVQALVDTCVGEEEEAIRWGLVCTTPGGSLNMTWFSTSLTGFLLVSAKRQRLLIQLER